MKEYLVFDNSGIVPYRFLINEYLLYIQNRITQFKLKHSNLSKSQLKEIVEHELSKELTETILKTINFEIVDEFNPKKGKEFTIRAGINYEAKLFEKEKIELRKERDFLNEKAEGLNEFEKSLKKYHLDIVRWQNNINSSENLFTSFMTFFIICSITLMVLIISG